VITFGLGIVAFGAPAVCLNLVTDPYLLFDLECKSYLLVWAGSWFSNWSAILLFINADFESKESASNTQEILFQGTWLLSFQLGFDYQSDKGRCLLSLIDLEIV